MKKFEFITQKQSLGFGASYGIKAAEITVDLEQAIIHISQYERILFFRKYAKTERDILISDMKEITVQKKIKKGTIVMILLGLVGFFAFGKLSFMLCFAALFGLYHKKVWISTTTEKVQLNITASSNELSELVGTLQGINPQISMAMPGQNGYVQF
ncbi:hypothetical protein SAMN05660742_11017 [Propionispira arboris]|uniref:Uncharacterized protein n=1 Tax=Propionispira arboris TaxID=84035 RepID=A0A1H6ZXK4_9FIRM|nr:hypothetical protein [Propionispira arboris]SEJ54462.1 hypothetical protein SAMN05660742_11017 [Propionispira arboris]